MRYPSIAALMLLMVTTAGAQVPCPLLPAGSFANHGKINAFAVYDDGSGPSLYAAGRFPMADGVYVDNIARWTGSGWSILLGGPIFPEIFDLAVFDDGTGEALYATGSFTTAGGVAAHRIARWDGTSWSAVGNLGLDSLARTLAVFDDGTGPALHVGGLFSNADGVPANRIAKWDGVAWSAVGAGAGPFPLGNVASLCVWDDGTGEALYVGGQFTTPGTNIVKWNGATWSTLSTGIDFVAAGPAPIVNDMTVHDDGTGPALFVGGAFDLAGGVSALNVARWDGTSWSGLGAGIENRVYALEPFDDGFGPRLYAGAYDSPVSTTPGLSLARWNGAAWTYHGLGTYHATHSLAAFDDGFGNTLFAGGAYWDNGVNSEPRVDIWECRRPIISLNQAFPGSFITLTNDRLVPGHPMLNLFSFEPCPTAIGDGPWLGLCFSSAATIVAQLINSPPFSYVASSTTETFGPYPSPGVPITLDLICLDLSSFLPSRVTRFTIQ